jgi:malonyl-CoA O-methyltransferase
VPLSRLRRLLGRDPEPEHLQRCYRAWSRVYDVGPGSPVQRANDSALALCVPFASHARGVALDVGCGTGRHEVLLRARGWDRVFGLDLSAAMLSRASGYSGVVRADLRLPPFRPVELVLCSLVLGHLAALGPALDVLCNLCRHGGELVLSDLHPRAIQAGLSPTCPGDDGRWWRVPHHLHALKNVVGGLHRRGMAVQLLTEPAPEAALPGEPRTPRLPRIYALRARRIAG